MTDADRTPTHTDRLADHADAEAHEPGDTLEPLGNTLSEAFVLLDNSSGDGPPSLLFENPVRVVSAATADEVRPALAEIEAGIALGLHAAGYISYEAGYALEPKVAALMQADHAMPLVWFGLYNAPIEMSHTEVDRWLAEHKRGGDYQFTDVTHTWDRAAYLKRFAVTQKMIRSGDIYQLNLTLKARFKLSGSPLTFYADLREKQPVLYGGIVDTGAMTIVSASPELFIAQSGRTIATRPMKGTAARRGLIEDDKRQQDELATDVKQRAENLMIVDLMRNDLGRISEIGSVQVRDLFTVETYKTLHQMTSGIQATLRAGVGLVDVMQAIFPPGSITGAPKIRAMELIGELESEPRGVYCGAIGHIAPGGCVQLNVAIRTPVVFRDGRGEMGIGSGVVYDSDGDREYDECLLKMKFLTDPPKPFELIETMLFVPPNDDVDGIAGLRDFSGGIWLQREHMARLAQSAAYFGYAFDQRKIEQAIADAVAAATPGTRLRVRLLLGERGETTVTTTPIDRPAPNARMRYVISPTRLDADDAFLFHKTTRRDLYDTEWAAYAASHGADDAVYLNADGALAEGSRTSIFIERDGVLLTPPLAAGLLPGTLRQALIDAGRAKEVALTKHDLLGDDLVFLGNSVRGLLPADMIADLSGSDTG